MKTMETMLTMLKLIDHHKKMQPQRVAFIF